MRWPAAHPRRPAAGAADSLAGWRRRTTSTATAPRGRPTSAGAARVTSPGLVQHGWTAVSPVATHFRDFPRRRACRAPHGACSSGPTSPAAGTPPRRSARRPPIGAQLLYLAAAAGPPPAAPRRARRRCPDAGARHPDPAGARRPRVPWRRAWRDAEGPATACLYAADAEDPDILAAYREAGHRVVVLGDRLDADFLWRLWTLLGRARRVVSNRLSTPVFYAGAPRSRHRGLRRRPAHRRGRVPGRTTGSATCGPSCTPQHVDPAVAARRSSTASWGPGYVRGPERPRASCSAGAVRRSSRRPSTGPPRWPRRAVVNLRRKAAAAPAAGRRTAAEGSGLSFAAWLRAATSYLPQSAAALHHPCRHRPRADRGAGADRSDLGRRALSGSAPAAGRAARARPAPPPRPPEHKPRTRRRAAAAPTHAEHRSDRDRRRRAGTRASGSALTRRARRGHPGRHHGVGDGHPDTDRAER